MSVEPLSFDTNAINVFPTISSSGYFTIVGNGKANATVYTLLGEKIYSSQINSAESEIDLSKQPNGVYFLQLKTAEGAAVKKIVKQ